MSKQTIYNLKTLNQLAFNKPEDFKFIGHFKRQKTIIIYPWFLKTNGELAFNFLFEYSVEELKHFVENDNCQLILQYGSPKTFFDENGADIVNSLMNSYCQEFQTLEDIDKQINLLLTEMPEDSNLTKFLALLNTKIDTVIDTVIDDFKQKYEYHYHELDDSSQTTLPRE